MNKDKQIEEMARDLRNVSVKVSNIIMEETHEFVSKNHKYSSLKDFHEAHPKGRNLMEAEFLTELGYAKASEVAREIFEEIEEYMLPALIGNKFPAKVINPDKFAEIKKKYTEGEG